MNISEVGNSNETALVCRIDQFGDGTGHWLNPNGTIVDSNFNSSEGFYIGEGSDGLQLLRGSGIPVEGIYTCMATEGTFTHVGIYNEGEGKLHCMQDIMCTSIL